MNKTETWKRCARQQSAQTLEELNENLEKLRQQESRNAEQIAAALYPISETLVMLAEETRKAIETTRKEAEAPARQTSQAAEVINQAANRISEALKMLEKDAGRRIKRFYMGILTASAISLPLIGWLTWSVWHAKAQNQTLNQIVSDLSPHLNDEQRRLLQQTEAKDSAQILPGKR